MILLTKRANNNTQASNDDQRMLVRSNVLWEPVSLLDKDTVVAAEP